MTTYNDMLSARQPFETYPDIIRAAARAAGGTAQVAGSVPAMYDGVTQGEPGMELSLFSREVIAMAASVALSHNVFDAAVFLGVCDKTVPGLFIACNEAFWILNLTAANAAHLTAFIASYSSPKGLRFAKLSAASTMSIAPILILGWFSQKQLYSRLTFGAVKQRT